MLRRTDGFSYSGMGGPMARAKTAKPAYRLLGAIIEDAGGNVFLGSPARLRPTNGISSNGWSRFRSSR
jgi:hypothetical protein